MPQRDKVARFLLDQDEGNLGNQFGGTNIEVPGLLPVAVGSSGPGEEKRILDFLGSSKYGALVTLAISAYYKPTSSNVFGGPVVARIEFGTGGAWTELEVDVPFGAAPSGLTKHPDLENGVLVSLPASSVRVMARNDGGVIPTNFISSPIGDIRLDRLVDGQVPNPVIVKAFIVKGTRSSFGRTGRFFPLASFAVATAIAGARYVIPAFAKNVRFLRTPIAAPVDYAFRNGFNGAVIDSGTVAAGVTSQLIPVPSQANTVEISIGGPGTTEAYADYEIGV